ncbi:MAG: toxin-antitoxin system HicB family antitoxin [Bacteroidales bacterium]
MYSNGDKGKKTTAFRLDESLLDKLKAEAKKANRSLNNYVECILMDSVYNEPNEITMAAINEARSGKHAGKFNMSNSDAFMKFVNEIE